MADSNHFQIVICYDIDARYYILDCDFAPEGKMIKYDLDQMDKSTLFGAIDDIITKSIIQQIQKNPKPEKKCLKVWSKNYCIMDFGDKNESYLKEILEIIEKHNSGSIATSANIDVIIEWKYAFLQTKDPYGKHYTPSLQKVEHVPTPPTPPIASIPKAKAPTEKKIIEYKIVTAYFDFNSSDKMWMINDKIAKLLTKGYVPCGVYSINTIPMGKSDSTTIISQAMCLYE